MKIIFIILVSFLFFCNAFATIINIPAEQSTIQAGINVATNGDTILVQPGTYVENINYSGKNITVASLFLTTQDTSYISQTVIGGDSLDSVVKFENGEDSTAVLAGFTIQNGYSYSSGGIYCYSSSPSLANVTITGNSAWSGGGIYCYSSSPSLENVTITGNSASAGGGIYCSNNSSPSLDNVTITGNSVSSGGGIYCSSSSPSLENVTITGNSASSGGGGIYYWGNSSPSLDNVTITGNSASSGGGIYCSNNSSQILDNVTITGNSASSKGGGIYCYSSSPILDNVTITGNSASSGGGIYYKYSSPSLDNVTITGNSASSEGGGIYCYSSSPSLDNVTITGNSASSNGGGIYCYDNSSPSLLNSIVSDNTGNKGIYVYYGNPTITYSDFWNNENGNYYGCSPGTGCIEADPLFVDPDNGNYHLTENSPCIDAGDPTSPLDPDGTITDIGAFYYHQSIVANFTADINQGPPPLTVQFTDLTTSQYPILSWQWDFQNDGTVDSYQQNPSYTYSDSGSYSVSLTITDEDYLNDIEIKENYINVYIPHVHNITQGIGYETIQQGIDGADAGDTILVDPGTYLENINYNGKNIVLGSLFLTTQDTSYISQTVIDGNHNESVVIFESEENSAAELNGFTIINGNSPYGGGIVCYYTSPTLTNVTIANNFASYRGGGIYCYDSSPSLMNVTILGNSSNYFGGGIYCLTNSNPNLENVVISGNSSENAGGICCYNNSSPILNNVTISSNSADDSGGGIFCYNYSNPNLYNVTILGNSATYGGGIYCHTNSNPILNAVTISSNSSVDFGGGICCYNNSNPNLENVTISNNSSENTGGGIYCNNSTLYFSTDNRCNIYLNDIINNRGYGVDICAQDCGTINVIVDTFTVITSNDYYTTPFNNFTFDILHSKLDSLINADVYVSVDGDNSNSGISPDEPFRTIKYALSRIYSDNLNHNTINLASGVYSDSTNGETFPIKWSNYVNLSGSLTNETILDANSNSTVMEFRYVTEANIMNITITNGNSTDGGGIACYYSSPNLINLNIIQNTASNNGGGIYCYNSSPSLDNVTITGNSHSGIYCIYSSPSLENVTITGNSGGGMNCSWYSSPSLENVTITGNSGGGMNCYGYSSPTLSNVTITDNSAVWDGGGMNCYGYSSPSLVDVTITDNSSSSRGGGIYCDYNSSPNLANVTITNNTASSYGGGIFFSSSSPSLENLTITGNSTSQHGGGIFCSSSSLSLENVTITGNSTSQHGGGIYCSESNLSFNVENRCNIYTNNITNSRGYGTDIFAYNCDTIDVIVDTFTVLNPSDYYASPIYSLNFDILHSIEDTLINSDLYISVYGDNSNSGTSPDEPFKTIKYAISRIYADSLNQHTIYLLPGIYSPSTNGEQFPIPMSNYVSLQGNSQEDTFLDSDSLSCLLRFDFVIESNIRDITIRNGNIGIYLSNSSPSLENVTITGNSSSGIYCIYSNPSLENVTISGNSAFSGGGIWCRDNSNPNLVNCILWNNTPQEVYFYEYYTPNSITISYSDIKDGESGIVTNNNGTVYWEEGNINADPLFVDPDNGDYHLTWFNLPVSDSTKSPCIDSGDPDLDDDGITWETDPDDQDPDGTRMDMGAYYFHNTTTYFGPTYYVSTTGSDENDGSAENPFATIQYAINVAAEYDTVLVSVGTYTENINYSGKNITVGSLFLTTQDTSYISQTIIDGNQNECVVKFSNGEDSTAVLCGFKITNGQGGGSSPNYIGGGITCRNNSSPSLANLTISGNSSSICGGGIYCYDNSSPSLENITISNNSASSCGGGIYCKDNSSPSLVDVTISGNSASTYGGGIYCKNNSSPSLVNVTISGNSASSWGGGIYLDSSDPSFNNVSITDNSASGSGGGIYCCFSSPSLVNVTISSNSATGWYGYGGGIYCCFSSPSLVNVTISNNSASYHGGGIYCYNNSSPSLVNVTISNNSAFYHGGGIYCYNNSNPSLVNVTISNNSAFYHGGGVYCENNSSPSFVCCILWNDTPQEVYFYQSSNPNSITFSYTDIEGGESGIVTNNNGTVYWEEGNINSDPLFVDPENEDYHLSWSNYPIQDSTMSPCIDSGDPDTTGLNLPPFDLDGNPRIVNGIIDMGAYEYQGEILLSPENVTISISSDSIYIQWDAVPSATSYKVYSSDDPYTGFTEDLSGTFAGESWTAPIPNVMKFYYVKAEN